MRERLETPKEEEEEDGEVVVLFAVVSEVVVVPSCPQGRNEAPGYLYDLSHVALP